MKIKLVTNKSTGKTLVNKLFTNYPLDIYYRMEIRKINDRQ